MHVLKPRHIWVWNTKLEPNILFEPICLLHSLKWIHLLIHTLKTGPLCCWLYNRHLWSLWCTPSSTCSNGHHSQSRGFAHNHFTASKTISIFDFPSCYLPVRPWYWGDSLSTSPQVLLFQRVVLLLFICYLIIIYWNTNVMKHLPYDIPNPRLGHRADTSGLSQEKTLQHFGAKIKKNT